MPTAITKPMISIARSSRLTAVLARLTRATGESHRCGGTRARLPRQWTVVEAFTPAELRNLRSLKDAYGIARFLADMPYHLATTARSPRPVLRENTPHCLARAIFPPVALRA